MTKSEFIIELLKFRDPGLGRTVENLVNSALKDAPELTEQSELEEELERFREFYFFMRSNHGHTSIAEAGECRVCKAMEIAKDPPESNLKREYEP